MDKEGELVDRAAEKAAAKNLAADLYVRAEDAPPRIAFAAAVKLAVDTASDLGMSELQAAMFAFDAAINGLPMHEQVKYRNAWERMKAEVGHV